MARWGSGFSDERQRNIDDNYARLEQREEAARLSAKHGTYVAPHWCEPEFGAGLKPEDQPNTAVRHERSELSGPTGSTSS